MHVEPELSGRLGMRDCGAAVSSVTTAGARL
jgi:hypothetical protein